MHQKDRLQLTDRLQLIVRCVVIAVAVASVTPGAAAGLELIASTQWGGFYVGAQLGGAWSASDWRFSNSNYFNTLGPKLVGTEFDHDASGVIGGGQVGFNYQLGVWVVGIEGSAAGADLRDSIQSPFFPGFDTYTTNVSWLTTVTGRVGFTQGRMLAYAKGGWAGADIRLNLYEANTAIRAISTQWSDGWTVGGGLEYALGPRLSLAGEYDYVGLDTGSWSLACTGCGTGVGHGRPVVDGDIAIQSVTARLNYRVGG